MKATIMMAEGMRRGIASLTPAPGEIEEDVLQDLTSRLDENGIPASFDPVLAEVSLNTPLLGGQTFFWGNDDPGLAFAISFDGGAVPEPASYSFSAPA